MFEISAFSCPLCVKNEPCVEESIKITPVVMQNCKCPSAWEIEKCDFFKVPHLMYLKLFLHSQTCLNITRKKNSTKLNKYII